MSKNTTQCVKAKEFNCDDVTYSKPSVNKYGGKNIKLGLNGGNGLVLQFPLMLTWGVNEWPNEQNGTVKYDLALQFEPHKSTAQAKFLKNMKAFHEKLLEDAAANSKEWFGKAKMSKEVAEAMTWPFVKCYTRDDGSESYTMKLKIPVWDNKFMVELYDTEGKPTYLMKGGDNNTKGTPVNLIQKGSHIVGLMKCTQISFVGGRWGISWSLVQAKVRPPQRLLGSGTCHVADDSDDEDAMESLAEREKAEEEEEEEEDSNSKPTFDDDDEDEEEEEEEEQPAPEPVKKKKKVVRRKKKTNA